MTSPGDDEFEAALRRALSEAASEVEPDGEGLDKIRARIAVHPPRPWLLSVLFGVVERVRNWTWRGHWARPGWLSRLAEAWWPRLRRGRFPGWGFRSFRLAAVLAAAAVLASVTLGVQPLRDALLQGSTAPPSDSGSPRVTVGTDGNAAPNVPAGRGPQSPVGVAPSGQPAPRAAKPPGTAKPPVPAPAKCVPGALPATGGSTTGVVTPGASDPAVAAPDSLTTDTAVVTCPVVSPAKSPAPAPTAVTRVSVTPAPTPIATAPAPAVSDPAPWPPPQGGYPSPPGSGWPRSPAPPSGSWAGRRSYGSPPGPSYGHGRWR